MSILSLYYFINLELINNIVEAFKSIIIYIDTIPLLISIYALKFNYFLYLKTRFIILMSALVREYIIIIR